jgi:hypothetical protein
MLEVFQISQISLKKSKAIKLNFLKQFKIEILDGCGNKY